MDPEMIRAGVSVNNLLVTFGLGAWMYLETRSDKTNDRVAELSKQLDKLEKELASLQKTVEGAPSHADLAKIYDSINGLSATVHKLVGENGLQTDLLRQLVQKEIGGKN